MDPLLVTGRLGKGIDLILRDLDPIADSDFLAFLRPQSVHDFHFEDSDTSPGIA
jgi:hypothetical protein